MEHLCDLSGYRTKESRRPRKDNLHEKKEGGEALDASSFGSYAAQIGEKEKGSAGVASEHCYSVLACRKRKGERRFLRGKSGEKGDALCLFKPCLAVLGGEEKGAPSFELDTFSSAGGERDGEGSLTGSEGRDIACGATTAAFRYATAGRGGKKKKGVLPRYPMDSRPS